MGITVFDSIKRGFLNAISHNAKAVIEGLAA